MTKVSKQTSAVSSRVLKKVSLALKLKSPGMSQGAVSKRLGITPSYWSKVLRGERPLTRTLLERVIRVFRLEAHQIAELQKSMLADIEIEKIKPVTGLEITSENHEDPLAKYRVRDQKQFFTKSSESGATSWAFRGASSVCDIDSAKKWTADEKLSRLL